MRSLLIRALNLTLAACAWSLFALALAFSLAQDVSVSTAMPDRVRAYLRATEFDFVDWTLTAIGYKVRQASVDEQRFLAEKARAKIVRDYFDLLSQLESVKGEIEKQYADPAVTDPAAETAGLRAMQTDLLARAHRLQPSAEAILQEQVATIFSEQGLLIFPPVSFHFTPLPYALIVSPRDTIRQDANLDVNGDLTLDQQVALEEKVSRELDVSTLVVGLGGIGTYPTMVLQYSDLNWIASVTAHEWTHNYLTLRPLGLNYETTPELRTMNETTAEMIGDEIGALVIARYYPELVPPPAPFNNFLPRVQPPEATPAAPGFDFTAEMHTTRVTADELLAQGKIEEAESYMEQRRQFMWNHGYQIRKLNQAYFAFYGAYAAGGGAPGADPVGPAVRLLRKRSPSLKYFLETMAGFTSFEALEKFLGLK
jgi:hypothetical protein